MGKAVIYEDFQIDGPAGSGAIDRDQELRRAAYEDGHLAGQQEAQERLGAEQDQLQSQLVQTFLDMSFGYQEAVLHLQGALNPLIAAMARAVLPRIADATLIDHIADLIAERSDLVLEQALELRVAPQIKDRIEKALADAEALPATVKADDTLTPLQAIVGQAGTETLLDLDAVVADVDAAVEAFFHEHARKAAHV